MCVSVCPRFYSSVSHFVEAPLMMFTDLVSGADEADMNVGHDFVMPTAARAHAHTRTQTHTRIWIGRHAVT